MNLKGILHEEDVQFLAESAYADACRPGNPRDTSVEEINALVKAASESEDLAGILGYNDELLVSTDFNGDDHSSIFDSTLTKVSGNRLVKVTAWYDNEWGFSNRMLDTACAMMAAK